MHAMALVGLAKLPQAVVILRDLLRNDPDNQKYQVSCGGRDAKRKASGRAERMMREEESAVEQEVVVAAWENEFRERVARIRQWAPGASIS